MSAALRLKAIARFAALSVAVAGIATLPSTRNLISKYLGHNGSRNIWRALAVLIALVNLKNIPGFWHIRVIRSIVFQLYFQPNTQKPKHLFAPMITSSFNTIYDCDWNLHKSNSTYFQDLDVARAHLVGCIVRTGLARLNSGDEEDLPKDTIEYKGRYTIALGAVSCFFQRQIEPLQQFEIYTRVLSWDRKWIYIVSHVVKKGAIKPNSYGLQPWKKSKRKGDDFTKEEEDLSKHIFASSLARYVFKKGRLTINPEIVLERSRLLPPRPASVGLPPRTESLTSVATPAPTETPATPALKGEASGHEAIATEIGRRLSNVANASSDPDAEWTWVNMERERLRGLKIASHFDSLGGGISGELQAGEVLGQYGDYW